MSRANILQALMDWLQGCPLIEGYAFQCDRLGISPLSLSLEMTPGEPITKRYLNGTTVRTKQFVVATREAYGEDVLTNLDNSGFWDEFTDWVEEQNRTRNYPDLGDGKTPLSVHISTGGYLYEADFQTARYQAQFTMTYEQEGTR